MTMRAPLLHNMSCMPHAPVKHEGRDACRVLRLRGEWAGPWPRRPRSFAALCPMFGLTPVPGDDGWRTLMALASEPCPALARMPAVAPVQLGGPATGPVHGEFTADTRLLLAVLARTAGGVFIRDRAPALTEPAAIRPLSLFAPSSWNPDQ